MPRNSKKPKKSQKAKKRAQKLSPKTKHLRHPLVAAVAGAVVASIGALLTILYQNKNNVSIAETQQREVTLENKQKELRDLTQEIERCGREHLQLAAAHMQWHADGLAHWIEKPVRDQNAEKEWSMIHEQKKDELWHNWSRLLSDLRKLQMISSSRVAALASQLVVLLERTSFHPNLTNADMDVLATRFSSAHSEGRLDAEVKNWLSEMDAKMELHEFKVLLDALAEGDAPDKWHVASLTNESSDYVTFSVWHSSRNIWGIRGLPAKATTIYIEKNHSVDVMIEGMTILTKTAEGNRMSHTYDGKECYTLEDQVCDHVPNEKEQRSLLPNRFHWVSDAAGVIEDSTGVPLKTYMPEDVLFGRHLTTVDDAKTTVWFRDDSKKQSK